MGQRKLGKMEGAKKCSFPGGVGKSAGRKTIVDLFTDSEEDDAELLLAQTAALRLCRVAKLLGDAQREPRNCKGRMLHCCG